MFINSITFYLECITKITRLYGKLLTAKWPFYACIGVEKMIEVGRKPLYTKSYIACMGGKPIEV